MRFVQANRFHIGNAQFGGIHTKLAQRVVFGDYIVFAVGTGGGQNLIGRGPVIVLLPMLKIADKGHFGIKKSIYSGQLFSFWCAGQIGQ